MVTIETFESMDERELRHFTAKEPEWGKEMFNNAGSVFMAT